jgi:uncharacterized membrane protein YbjE (DUF340 family)
VSTLSIALCLVAGAVAGHLLSGSPWLSHCDAGISALLYAMLFFVGLDLGSKGGIRRKLREIGADVLVLPALVIVGSLAGAWAAGRALGMAGWQSAAVGAGFGWYSLSGVLLGGHDAALGAVAFLSNIIREVLALLLIPIFVKIIHPWAGIAAAGATAMDTTLPVVVKASGTNYAIQSFLSGVILSTMVPIVISILFAIAGV